jgi:hypothetical protein
MTWHGDRHRWPASHGLVEAAVKVSDRLADAIVRTRLTTVDQHGRDRNASPAQPRPQLDALANQTSRSHEPREPRRLARLPHPSEGPTACGDTTTASNTQRRQQRRKGGRGCCSPTRRDTERPPLRRTPAGVQAARLKSCSGNTAVIGDDRSSRFDQRADGHVHGRADRAVDRPNPPCFRESNGSCSDRASRTLTAARSRGARRGTREHRHGACTVGSPVWLDLQGRIDCPRGTFVSGDTTLARRQRRCFGRR